MDRQVIHPELYRFYRQPQYQNPAFSSLAYRSLALPPRPPELQGCSAELHHLHHHHNQPRFVQQPSYLQPGSNMAYMQSEEDLAEFQKLSNEYEPQTTGPLVGLRQTTDAITTEYAAADPTYRTKTAALPLKYSFYRTCRGDGRCGWRAIAFGYFESLVRIGDRNKFLQEETRLRSLVNVITGAEYDWSMVEDFADDMFDLLRKIGSTLQTGDPEAALLEAFNDEAVQNNLITYLRLLTASWIKTRPDGYTPFVLPLTVDEYCDGSIMPHGSEINEIGINALSDVLTKPAGISLEIIYLDRSMGDEANVHHYGPMSASTATTRLLYRPGHYDLLYKPEDIPVVAPAPIQSTTIPTYLQYSDQLDQPFYEHGVSDVMTMIPGISLVGNQHAWISNPLYEEPGFGQTIMPVRQHQPAPIASTTPVFPTVAPPIQFLPTLDRDYGMPGPSAASLNAGGLNDPKGVFRPSIYQSDYQSALVGQSSHLDMDFRTAQFKNSHFNTAHFLNPDFHPEEWYPNANEYVLPGHRHGNGNGRHRHSG